jgi:hypothetical protein
VIGTGFGMLDNAPAEGATKAVASFVFFNRPTTLMSRPSS